MNPLIIRPQPAADELASRLCADGHHPVVCPLLSYSPGHDLPALVSRLPEADFIIAVSTAAVQYADRHLQQLQVRWPVTAHYLAVGASTAGAWQLPCPVITPDDARSEGLLALQQLQSVDGKNILILRGNGGRELLSETLQQRGADVTYVECYRRHYLQTDGHRLLQEWQAAAVDSVIITSNDLFQQLLTLLPDTAQSWLSGLYWFAASERIAEKIRNSGFTQITIMSGAQHQTVAAALLK